MNPIIRLLTLFGGIALLLGACGDDDTSTASEDEAESAAEDALDEQLGGDCGFLGEFAGAGFEAAMAADPTAGFSDGGDAYAAAAEEFQEVADAAPDEIQDAFQTMADGMSEWAEAFADVDLSDPSNIDPSVFERFEEGPGEDFEAAADEVDTWIQEHCPGMADG